MAEITDADVQRLKALIDRLESDVYKSTVAFDGGDTATYTTTGGDVVPSYQKWLLDRSLRLAGAKTTVATGNITLTLISDSYQFVDTNGANRTVTLPSGASSGDAFLISNIGAESINVLEPDAITILWANLVSPFSVAVVFDGVAWRVV